MKLPSGEIIVARLSSSGKRTISAVFGKRVMQAPKL